MISLKKKKQVISLYTSSIFSIFFGVFVSIINTKYLSVEDYGNLKFLQTVFSMVAIFVTFGFFVTGRRLLAITHTDEEKKSIIGSLVCISCVLYAVMAIILIVFSYYEKKIFKNNLDLLMRCIAPFTFFYLIKYVLEKILIGINSIFILAVMRFLPSVGYIVISCIVIYLNEFSLKGSLIIQIVCSSSIFLFIIMILKPNFSFLKKNIYKITKYNQEYGFNVYIATLLGVCSAQIGIFIVSYLLNNENVGFYSLAVVISSPLAIIPNSVATCFYTDFCKKTKIPLKETFFTIKISFMVLIFYLLSIKKIVSFIYPDKYIISVYISYITSIGYVLHGFGDYINNFLSSQGKSIYIKKSSFCLLVINIAGYFILIDIYGIIGAGLTRLISGIAYFVMMYYFYKKFRKENQKILN